MTGIEGGFEGRSIPDPGFAGDDGSAPPGLLDALGSGDLGCLVDALLNSRVLVPVVAVLGESEPNALGHLTENSADMAVVTIRAPSGRVALPAFSSVQAMAAWDGAARPVPVSGAAAAVAALDEAADALVVDLGTARRRTVDGPALRALAEGRRLIRPAEDPAVVHAIEAAAASVGVSLDHLSIAAGEDADVVVVLSVDGDDLGTHEATRAAELGRVLSSDPVLRGRLGRGLDLVVSRTPGEQ